MSQQIPLDYSQFCQFDDQGNHRDPVSSHDSSVNESSVRTDHYTEIDVRDVMQGGAQEIFTKHDLYDFFLDLYEKDWQTVLKARISELIEGLKSMLSSSRAHLFLECRIDSPDKLFSELEARIQEKIFEKRLLRDYGQLSADALRAFENEWTPIIEELTLLNESTRVKEKYHEGELTLEDRKESPTTIHLKSIILETLFKIRSQFIELLRNELFIHSDLEGRVKIGDTHDSLGGGGFGKVHTFADKGFRSEQVLGFVLPDQVPLAIKVFAQESSHCDFPQNVADILLTLHHPNLMRFFGYMKLENTKIALEEYIVKGHCLQELLSDRTNDFSHLNLDQIFDVILQTLQGCQPLLEAGLAHNDVKPANIVVVSDDERRVQKVKLIDFDTVGVIGSNTSGVSGTLKFIAPERFSTHTPSEKSDVYSFGAMLCWILFNKTPYQDGKHIELDQFFRDLSQPLSAYEALPSVVLDTLKKLLAIEPHDRASLSEATSMISAMRNLVQSDSHIRDYLQRCLTANKRSFRPSNV